MADDAFRDELEEAWHARWPVRVTALNQVGRIIGVIDDVDGASVVIHLAPELDARVLMRRELLEILRPERA